MVFEIINNNIFMSKVVYKHSKDALTRVAYIVAGGSGGYFFVTLGFSKTETIFSYYAGVQYRSGSGLAMERAAQWLERPVYVVGCHTAGGLYRHSIHKLVVKQRRADQPVRYQTAEDTVFSGVHHHTAILQRRRLQEFCVSVCLLHYILYAADRNGYTVIFIPHYYKGCLTEVGRPLLCIYYQARVVVRG